jgi:hypothetical protein
MRERPARRATPADRARPGVRSAVSAPQARHNRNVKTQTPPSRARKQAVARARRSSSTWRPLQPAIRNAGARSSPVQGRRNQQPRTPRPGSQAPPRRPRGARRLRNLTTAHSAFSSQPAPTQQRRAGKVATEPPASAPESEALIEQHAAGDPGPCALIAPNGQIVHSDGGRAIAGAFGDIHDRFLSSADGGRWSRRPVRPWSTFQARPGPKQPFPGVRVKA